MVDRINGFARKVPTWPLYIIYLLPVPWLLYLAQTGGLGREPIKALEHELGEIALQLLILGLTITPLRRYLGINLIKFRRMLGLLAFTYVTLHLAVWVVLDMNLLWSQMWADVWKRPYITIGMAGFLALVPLAITSNNASVRKLGAAGWRNLHKLTYAAVLMGGIHYIWLVKGIQIEPLIYMAVIVILLALRLPKRKAPQRA
ncbi:protein-methionine-sulfoxide reductase heme-binding subunit MsrQ [Sulfitobacter aestuariivivens]|uniref:Protein-methionine-sulfoxide reductase heme-binding subunit MsrQ n=1 Tax=Sulfitobacter aestuariivivens TaxID=2766981 RepID=A0A927HFW9_9RHOB|nr:protein-methionine-sulfoxide reductase heme-binding subunit MsrQ [Sulfitobacter aestuariivivens]MBD3666292.1 protein-methionine-sulfoxide reductase heme-binding subunit MsrQ [Sulfitobacter aestuariivivens]